MLIKRECNANWRVIQRCAAPERNDKTRRGMPKPIPNQKKTFKVLNASPNVSDKAKILTTNGPEQGNAMGPYNKP